jgi:hypothetical protein
VSRFVRTFGVELAAAAVAYLVIVPLLLLATAGLRLSELTLFVLLTPTILGVFGVLALVRVLRWQHIRLGDVVHEAREETKWRRHFTLQINALVRRQLLAPSVDTPYPYRLLVERFHLRSQNEEDGLLLALIRMAGVTCHSFVEIGAGVA